MLSERRPVLVQQDVLCVASTGPSLPVDAGLLSTTDSGTLGNIENLAIMRSPCEAGNRAAREVLTCGNERVRRD